MIDPARRDRVRRIASRVGLAASAVALLSAGWLATRDGDWRTVTVVSLLAGAAGVVVAVLSARGR